eukprot:510761-Pelagomonas_calceolata.AAC.7
MVQELEVWTRSAADWNEDVSFLPFCSCKTLRSLKLERTQKDEKGQFLLAPGKERLRQPGKLACIMERFSNWQACKGLTKGLSARNRANGVLKGCRPCS